MIFLFNPDVTVEQYLADIKKYEVRVVTRREQLDMDRAIRREQLLQKTAKRRKK